MDFYRKVRAQQDQVDDGTLKVSVFTEDGTRPVEDALVRISYTGESGQTVEEVRTDSSGQTPVLDLKTPPLEYSMEPVEEQPYAEYTIQVEAEGFENTEIAGTQVLPGVQAQQAVKMAFRAEASFERLVIGPHTLFAEYPPKIEEAEVKPVDESGEIVLSRVVIPEYIVVHDGSVNDTTAPNYYERYRDYIKNVASSEIYATWPDDTIRANILAIMSFTLNRVYTEWYRNKGKDLRSHPPQRMTTSGSGEEMYLTVFPELRMNFLKIISPGRMCASQFLHSTVTDVGYSAEIVAG